MVVFADFFLSPSYVTLVESSHAHLKRKITIKIKIRKKLNATDDQC